MDLTAASRIAAFDPFRYNSPWPTLLTPLARISSANDAPNVPFLIFGSLANEAAHTSTNTGENKSLSVMDVTDSLANCNFSWMSVWFPTSSSAVATRWARASTRFRFAALIVNSSP